MENPGPAVAPLEGQKMTADFRQGGWIDVQFSIAPESNDVRQNLKLKGDGQRIEPPSLQSIAAYMVSTAISFRGEAEQDQGEDP